MNPESEPKRTRVNLRPGRTRRESVALTVVALSVTGFILYGSLYPFVFRDGQAISNPIVYLFSTWKDWDRRGDLLSNILLYSPFGFFVTRVLPNRIPAIARLAAAILAGIALSMNVEIAQFHDEGRVTSMGDVYANAIGSTIGAITAAVLRTNLRWPLVQQLADNPDAALLLATFPGYRLFPYVPVIDIHKYWHALDGLVRQPIPVASDFIQSVIAWLCIAAVIDRAYGFRRWLLLAPLSMMGSWAGCVLIVDLRLTSADIAGPVTALVLWGLVLRWLPGQLLVVGFLFAGLIIFRKLQPFDFDQTPMHDFGWMPVWPAGPASVASTFQALCEKSFFYGGAIWLFWRARMPLTASTGLVAAVAFGTSFAAIYRPGISPNVSDTILTIGIGAVFVLLAAPRATNSNHAA